MAYEIGDRLVALDEIAGLIHSGEEVVVVAIDDGAPVVEVSPTDEQPAGRNVRLDEVLIDKVRPV